MSLRLFLLALLLASAPLTSQARIGETPDECVARYGPGEVSEKDSNIVTYSKSGYLITCIFTEGKAAVLNLSKLDRNALGNGKPLSPNEIQTILEANGNGRTWEESAKTTMDLNFQTTDGELFARYRPLQGDVFITTKDNLLRQNAERKAQEKKALEGF